MLNLRLIQTYTDPIYNLDVFDEEFILDELHLGKTIKRLGANPIHPDAPIDIAIVGVNEIRGSKWLHHHSSQNVNPIRAALYNLYEWHNQFSIIDLGNLKKGVTLQDTYAALQEICTECLRANVLLIVLGGSHDLLIPQYKAFQTTQTPTHLCNIDALIDLDKDKRYPENNYLENIFFYTPKMLESYTHIGFQSYYTHPKLLKILDELHCSCLRLGFVKDHPYEIEPEIRSANLISFDISAISSAFSPISQTSPNGLSGEEACTIARFAGMSEAIKVIGFYGYYSFLEHHSFSAQLIAQMIWYLIEGMYFKEKEGKTIEIRKHNCNVYYTSFNQLNTEFYQNKITKRWWMRVNDHLVIPCSYNDYKKATCNEIPERFLKHSTQVE